MKRMLKRVEIPAKYDGRKKYSVHVKRSSIIHHLLIFECMT